MLALPVARMDSGNVLVVEDDDDIRRLLMEYLEQHSYLDVDGARDGVEALHQISQKSYAIILLDLMMPKMSGVDFLDSLNALVCDPSIKALERLLAILVVTAAPPNEVSNEAIASRCPSVRAIFRKPLDIVALGERVEMHLREARIPAKTGG